MKRPPFVLIAAALLPATSSQATGQTFLHRLHGAQIDDRLGTSIGKAGDLDQDGHADFLVGGNDRAWVFSGRLGTVRFPLSRLTQGEDFGAATAGIGDLNQDGVPDLLVGAPARSGTGRSGAVDLFSGATGQRLTSFTMATFNALGHQVAALGDVNADGAPDFVATAPNSNAVLGISGRTGALLYSVAFGGSSSGRFTQLTAAGDVDRDGVADFTAGDGSAGVVIVCSGRSGGQLRRIDPRLNQGLFGCAVGNAGDVDRDGTPDLVIGAPNEDHPITGWRGALWVVSGRTGATLHHLFSPPGTFTLGLCVSGAGDLNQDGFADFAATGLTRSGNQGRLHVFSGRDGSVLMTLEGISSQDHQEYGRGLREIGDVNQDGTLDLAVTNSRDSQLISLAGSMHVVSGVPFATTAVLGEPCGGGPFLPNLRTTRPILGRDATVAGMFAPAGAVGAVLWSALPNQPLDLGGGCVVHLDVLSLMPLAAVPNPDTWGFNVPLPADRTLAGTGLRLQALFFPTAGHLGFDLTNGVEWRLGY